MTPEEIGMSRVTSKDLLAVIEELKAQVSALSERVARFEGPPNPEAGKPSFASSSTPAPEPAETTPPAPEPQGITEEEVLAISAAIAAYLGVRVHVRQIRLISSHMWAQEGRASIQASHRLHN
jgi:methylmalonyl-CoA carboxyltransferase large subunit